MLVIIPLSAAVLSIFLFRDLLDRELPGKWREPFLAAVIVMGAVIALSTEALSLVNAINRLGVTILWLLVLSVVLTLAWKRKAFQRYLGVRERLDRSSWSASNRLSLVVSLSFVGILFVVAWLAPPNTNDSLSYHLSRVMHWIQNQGLAHYPTAIDRQLWMPPWAEMAVLHLHLLKGDDGLSNLVQWLSKAASLVAISMIAARLGAGRSGQLFAVLFCATLPMGILQATSTQTDYATALWLLCLAYYSLVAHQRRLTRLEWVLLCLVAGLGILTKGTFYTFALPFLTWLLVSTWRRDGWQASARFTVLGMMVVGLLNAGTWARNTATYGFPLGPRQAVEALANDSLRLGVLASNLIRNSTLHLGTSYGVVNGPAYQTVDWIHRVIGQDLQDPRTTLDEYRIKRYLHEDRAGNPFHFLLVPVTLLMLLIPASGRVRFTIPLLFALLVLSTFLIFSALYKWQSTGSRLLLPFFVAWSPVAGMAFERPRFSLFKLAGALVLIAAAVQPLISNPSRALLPLSPDFVNLLTTPRNELLFANSPEVMPAYISLASELRLSGCQEIGLKIDSSDIEYPFWVLLQAPESGVRIEHIDVEGASSRYAVQDFRPCAVICSYCEDEFQHALPLFTVYQGQYFLYLAASTTG